MGKRLYRIKGREVSNQKDKLYQKECDIILINKVTVHGIIVKIENEELQFTNMLNTLEKIRLAQIEEIIYDKESAW